MSEFSGYEKMPDTFKKLGFNEKELSRAGKLRWVVTEKIHGANFSFVYENAQLKFAKRREYLSWTDDFFGFQLVASKLETNIVCLFERLSAAIPATKYIVYGELFGGSYPHPDVEPIENLQAIQTGVFYSPDIHFAAFDIAIEESDGNKHYLDYKTAVYYFEQFGIFYAKPLLIGKSNEALNFNIRINSNIPKLLGMPELEQNLIEGVVVKPYDLKDLSLLSRRPILKIKNPEFDEEEKFHQAEKWNFIPDVVSKTESLSFIVDELRKYITHNRLNSAISKIGPLDMNNPQRVSDIQIEFSQDILTDFNANNQNILQELEAEDMEWIKDRLISGINRLMIEQ
ncbi:MAG: hypothetical protein LBJ04_09640 [Sphingobacterium sp.]|jgi:Rnl2 family RNA ligase|uniref:RNA ligase family protein n=1 Tax=Sphingobacterium sp. TaxID=341027 RepID=UPI00281A7ED7|nr:RNA ligase family protein [Sphingobacterium sp.]MDR0263475.1 hypothetical protein [Sphingobacterium sp.]